LWKTFCETEFAGRQAGARLPGKAKKPRQDGARAGRAVFDPRKMGKIGNMGNRRRESDSGIGNRTRRRNPASSSRHRRWQSLSWNMVIR